MFRAVVQARLVQALAGVEALRPAATALGLGCASLLFGLLHALTPTYFVLATIGGAVFGAEYLGAGLPAAAFTHAAYDFVALVYIIHELGGTGDDPGDDPPTGAQ